MSEPTQVEPTVPAGSGDPDFDAALVAASATEPTEPEPAPSEPAEPTAPEADPDFTVVTLENGQREIKLATGEVYRGKDDAEVMANLAKGKVAASKHIAELSRKTEPAPVAPIQVSPEEVDPTALAIADLMAPAFKHLGIKSGAELVAAFAEQQRTAQANQEYMAAQAANMEAANFFRAVPEFSKSQADADKIDTFLNENGLSFNAKTAEMAYYTLKAKGEMTAAPTATRTTAPKNGMPAPPVGTAPANTGKGQPTTADLYAMTTEQLEALMAGAAPQ